MSNQEKSGAIDAMAKVSPRALRWGVAAWAALGVVAILAVTAWLFAATASISIPVLLAVILGFLFEPTVTALSKRHIPRALGAAIVLLALVIVFVGLIALVISSMGSALSELEANVTDGTAALSEWAKTLDVPADVADSVSGSVTASLPALGLGIASSVSSGLSGTMTTLVMIVMALYICYLMLIDDGSIVAWVGRHLGVPAEVGDEFVRDTASAVRGYFKGATLLGLVTGVATTIGLFLVGAPLPVLAGVITLVLSYIPYIGAFVAGAFAVVIAFGAGGWELALYALLVVLFVQMVLQTFIQAPLMGSALQLNAVVVFVVTMLGGIVAGALGAMLAAPAISAVLEINRTLDKWHAKNVDHSSPIPQR